MNTSQKYHVEWNKPKTKEPLLYNSIHLMLIKEVKLSMVEVRMEVTRGWVITIKNQTGNALWQLPAWLHFCENSLNCIVLTCAFFFVNIMPQYKANLKNQMIKIFELLTTLGMLKLRNRNGRIFCWVIIVYLEKCLIIHSTDTLEWFQKA